jgi:hypothetical protein
VSVGQFAFDNSQFSPLSTRERERERERPFDRRKESMPLIRRRSAGLCFLVGLFFGGPRVSPWRHACHGFLHLDAKPRSASMTRRRHRHHQQQVLTSLRMHPAVDLLSQQHDWSVVPHSSEIITSSNLLLGTDATLHAMANVMDPTTTTTTMTPPPLALPDSISNVIAPATATASSASSSSAAGTLSPTTTVLVFVVGLIPFAVATVEFWRRVALRLPFGTGGKDESVLIVIGDDNNRQMSRGRRVLGNDAIVVAIVLFGVAAAVIGIVVASVLTSTPPPDAY